MHYQKQDEEMEKKISLYRLLGNILVVKKNKNSYFFDPEALIVFSKTARLKDEEIASDYNKNQKIVLEKKREKIKKFLDFPHINLELHVINDCNLKCKYCYVDDNVNKENKKQMSQEIIEKAFRFAYKNSPNAKTFNIVLFGGEPLLFWKEFDFLIKKAKEIFERKKFKVSFPTNGTILSDEIVKVLKDNNISFQLSIDGPQKQQDFLRPGFKNKGSYKSIDKNISRFLNIQNALSVRTTITPYNMDLSNLFLFFKEKGFKRINFYLCSSLNKDLIIKDENLQDLFFEWEKLAELYLKHLIEDEKIIQVMHFQKFLQALHFGEKRYSYCGIEKNVISVSIEGGIYLCHRFIDNDSYKIGDLDLGFYEKAKKNVFDASIEKERCKSCFAKYLCGGGCAHESSVSFLEISCQTTRYILSLSIWMYGELSTKYPKAFEKLIKTFPKQNNLKKSVSK